MFKSKIIALVIATAGIATLGICGCQQSNESTPEADVNDSKVSYSVKVDDSESFESSENESSEAVKYSQGLEFYSLGDGKAALAGRGQCTDSDIVIPPMTPDGDKVIKIEDSAFEGDSTLGHVVIPEGVEEIGKAAFMNTRIGHVDIPDSVVRIHKGAFCNCCFLQDVVLPENAIIEGYVFCGCKSITSIIIPKGCTRIPDSAFFACTSLTEVVIHDNVTEIGPTAFSGCQLLANIHLPNNLTKIDDRAFSRCESLTEINIPNSVVHIGLWAFEGTGLKELVLPDSIDSLPWEDLSEIDGAIMTGIIVDCWQLTSVEIPEHLFKELYSLNKQYVKLFFEGCDNLQTVNGVPFDKWISSYT